MKNPKLKKLLFILLSIMAVLVVFVLYSRSDSESGQGDEPGSYPTSKDAPKTVSQTESANGSVQGVVAGMTEEERDAKPVDMEMEEWAYFITYHRRDSKKNGKIEFYGKVVNADGDPLFDLTVDAKVSGFNPSIAEVVKSERKMTTKQISVTTDRDGRFSITGMIGVTLLFQKIDNSTDYKIEGVDGYGFTFVPEGVNSAFDSSHQSVRGEPVVFVVSSLGEK